MSSGTSPGRRVAKVALSSPHCHIEVLAWQHDDGRLELRSQLQHAADASKCKCRRHPDAAQESRNDATLLSHVYSLQGVDGTVMAGVFAKLKLGFGGLEPDHMLPWDRDSKMWIPRS
ncbi:hypothetical protein F4824DRAFT_494420 [Ustulina deusta]|nr:hypothetical protein F4824DRAFT_494420 [Ustulina deusta]